MNLNETGVHIKNDHDALLSSKREQSIPTLQGGSCAALMIYGS
jgi:hypothetical protein